MNGVGCRPASDIRVGITLHRAVLQWPLSHGMSKQCVCQCVYLIEGEEHGHREHRDEDIALG